MTGNGGGEAAFLGREIRVRARDYFPDLSKEFSIELLHRGRPWVRKHSVLFEISILDHSKKTIRGVFVKIPRRGSCESVKRVYETLVDLYEFSRHLPNDLNVVRPVDFLPEIRAIVTERVDGRSFDALLRSRPGDATHGEIIESCGRFLRLYHQEMGRVAWEDDFAETFLQRCTAYLNDLEADGVDKRERQRIRAGFEEGIDSLQPGAPMGLTVKDYNVGNIVVQGKSTFFIEVTEPRRRAIYDDLAGFLISLTMLYWKTPWFLVGSTPPRTLSERFLRTYFHDGSIPIGLVSYFAAQILCRQWHRLLESLSGRKHGIAGLIGVIPLRHRINQFFYRQIMDHLELALVTRPTRVFELKKYLAHGRKTRNTE